MIYQGHALHDMLENAVIYEQWKQYLGRTAKISLAAAIITGLLMIFFLITGNYYEMYSSQSPDLILEFTEDWFVQLQYTIHTFATPLLLANAINISIACIVLAISNGTLEPVREPIHWLAHASGIQAGINILLATLSVIVIAIIIVLNIVAAICIGIALIIGFVGALSSS